MSLFQPSVLAKYLKLQDSKLVDKRYKKFTKHFHNVDIQQNIREIKEEQYQAGFLTALFVDVFGYTLNPMPKFDLTTEFKNEKGAKKADGAILKNDQAIAVIELKGTKTKNLEKIRQQAFEYKANQSACVYVITSNFEKLRFYIDNAVDHLEFDLFTLTLEEFMLLNLCVSQENIVTDLPKKIKEDSLRQEKNITDTLYKDYSLFKRELFRELVKANIKNEVFRNELNSQGDEQAKKGIKRTLFKKSQKFIDRLLFIFFAEDRNLLAPNSTLKILQDWNRLKELDAVIPLYERFKQYFSYLDTGRVGTEKQAEIYAYNGGLFKPDPILDSLIIDDELLYTHTYKLSEYDFASQVDVNILGHIFENSLNEIESVNAEIDGVAFDKQKTKRKKDGVFYTPKYITKYIVDNTVGKLCDKKKIEYGILEEEYLKGKKGRPKAKIETLFNNVESYRKWLLTITICDPACGSGAFLNQALDFLIKEHAYLDGLVSSLTGSPLVLSNIETIVLENNIFGVDLNEESVEIAKLSLWLRTARPRRKLNNLSSNIKCGNSLIDDPKVAEGKAFNWEIQFPSIFKNGGFDVVIGNPPYGASFSESDKEYIVNQYESYQYKFESYLYFYEKGIDILNTDGRLSFITPELFLRLEKSEKIRQLIFNKTELQELKFCGEDVFSDVKVNSVIVTLKKGKSSRIDFSIVPEVEPDWKYAYSDWEAGSLYKIEYEVSPNVKSIIDKIEAISAPLGSFGEAIQGLTPYDSYRGHSKELIKSRGFHFDEKIDESCGKWLDGKHVNRYALSEGAEWLRYGEWLAAKRESRFFEGARILFREVPGQNKRIQATYTDITYYHGHSITPFVLNGDQPKERVFEILGVANSKLLSWLAKYKSSNFSKNTFPKLNPKDIKQFPIPQFFPNDSKITSCVKSIMEEQEKLDSIVARFPLYLQSQFSIDILSRKLLNWHILEFGEFIKELNKVVKKAGNPPLTKLAEMNWMEVFDAKKAEARKLMKHIEKTDAEIDVIVYELFGLTVEEISIVEQFYA